jgi:hypothetical protein
VGRGRGAAPTNHGRSQGMGRAKAKEQSHVCDPSTVAASPENRPITRLCICACKADRQAARQAWPDGRTVQLDATGLPKHHVRRLIDTSTTWVCIHHAYLPIYIPTMNRVHKHPSQAISMFCLLIRLAWNRPRQLWLSFHFFCTITCHHRE